MRKNLNEQISYAYSKFSFFIRTSHSLNLQNIKTELEHTDVGQIVKRRKTLFAMLSERGEYRE